MFEYVLFKMVINMVLITAVDDILITSDGIKR